MKLSVKAIFFLLISIGLIQQVQAQRVIKRQINGFVRDSITGVPIVNAIISNESSKKMTMPNQEGFFSITAAPNDIIFINAFNYNYDTLIANNNLPDTLEIALVREPEYLPGVTVTTTTKGLSKYQMDSMRRREAFVQEMGAPKMSTVSKANNMPAGTAINLDKLFSKKDKDRTKAYNSFDYLEKQAYIDYRFSSELVSQYTGFKGDSLIAFMRQYTPTYEWLRAHPTDEDIVYYINDSLKAFANKPKQS
jgi:hypothetical protein